MKRGSLKRLLVGFLLPAPLGALALSCIDIRFIYKTTHSPVEFLMEWSSGLVLFTAFGYLWIGIQSGLYSTLMEYLINRRIRWNLLVIVLSALLGVLVSLSLPGRSIEVGQVAVGSIVGTTLGILLRRMYIRSANKAL
jgi:hypothetical protein